MIGKEELRELYGHPKGRAASKVLPALEKHSKHFISLSPFVILSTYARDGKVDTSPRGGVPGFVYILDNHQLLIPDAKGNNRVDSLQNIAETGRIGMLFLLPGIDETLRINGLASIVQDESYLSLFKDNTQSPKTCVLVEIEEVFLHCAKALMRSQLWNPDNHLRRHEFPTMGRMLKDQLGGNEEVESHEDMVKRYMKDL